MADAKLKFDFLNRMKTAELKKYQKKIFKQQKELTDLSYAIDKELRKRKRD